MDIDYDNYKDSITDKAKDRHDAYLSVWWELTNLQRVARAAQKSSSANVLSRITRSRLVCGIPSSMRPELPAPDSGRFRGEADMNRQARRAGLVETDPSRRLAVRFGCSAPRAFAVLRLITDSRLALGGGARQAWRP